MSHVNVTPDIEYKRKEELRYRFLCDGGFFVTGLSYSSLLKIAALPIPQPHLHQILGVSISSYVDIIL